MVNHLSTRPWLWAVVGILLSVCLPIQDTKALSESATLSRDQLASQVLAHLIRSDKTLASTFRNTPPPLHLSLERLAEDDPVGFFEMILARYERHVRDYTCLFTKQELVNGKMTSRQVMKSYYREDPYSVRLEWIKNRDRASRVLYVRDAWIQKGQQMAVIEPGPIARLFISYVMRPINGADAKKTSRRTIDQFGFRNNMLLILKYCWLSRERGILDFTYQGVRVVEGRSTLLFERRLPYTGELCEWPDRVLEVYVDRQLLVPTLCVAYADDAKSQLLGHYEYSDIKINANLSESVFTKKGMGVE
jgi:hypothetical protein